MRERLRSLTLHMKLDAQRAHGEAELIGETHDQVAGAHDSAWDRFWYNLGEGFAEFLGNVGKTEPTNPEGPGGGGGGSGW